MVEVGDATDNLGSSTQNAQSPVHQAGTGYTSNCHQK
jgi:hypothetical protein